MLHRIQLKTSARTVTENSLIRAGTGNAIARVAILSLFLALTLVFAQAPARLNRLHLYMRKSSGDFFTTPIFVLASRLSGGKRFYVSTGRPKHKTYPLLSAISKARSPSPVLASGRRMGTSLARNSA